MVELFFLITREQIQTYTTVYVLYLLLTVTDRDVGCIGVGVGSSGAFLGAEDGWLDVRGAGLLYDDPLLQAPTSIKTISIS